MGKSVSRGGGHRPASSGGDVFLAMAARAHQAGQLAEAERLYRQLLQAEPRHAAAAAMLAVVLSQQGRAAEGVAHAQAAARRMPDYGNLYNCGQVLRAAGLFREAGQAFFKAARLRPEDPRAPWDAALSWREAGLFREAAGAFDSVAQRDPQAPEPWIEAGRAWLAAGEAAQGLDRLRQALQRFPGHAELCRAVCAALDSVTFQRHDPWFQEAFGVWAAMPDAKPVWFTARLFSLLKLDPALAPLLAAAPAGFPETALEEDRLIPLFTCRPLLAVMIHDVVADPDFEILLTALRRTMTRAVCAGRELTAEAREFLLALALACHAGEFAMPEDDTLAEAVATLAGEVTVPTDPAAVDRLAVLACHRPLADLPAAPRLAEAVAAASPAPFSPALIRLLSVTVAEPLRERQLRSSIVPLTAVDDDVSLAVARQYDENPYPRWFVPPDELSDPFERRMRQTFPHHAFAAAALAPRRVLVAGCGSGWQAFCAARAYPEAEILAVDISTANLAHALRAQEKFGFANVTFRRADIMRLGELGQSFDLIESNGVLHHMADPLAGWRVLTGLLPPGGLMRIGLYSEIARRSLRQIEDFARRNGFGGDAAGLRAFRAAALALGEEHPVGRVVRSKEFYALSSLRDLAFHVNEHRFTIPALAEAFTRLGLGFVGFQLHFSLSRSLYQRRFPGDPAMTDLANWAAFEEDNPHSFAGCYDFWCEKGREL